MYKENPYEFERLQCMMLKAQFVSQMTDDVKSKILNQGFTPAEMATAFILKMYHDLGEDLIVFDPHQAMLGKAQHAPSYQELVYDDAGEVIVDIIF